MTESSAQLSNYRQPPRKVGLVVGAIRGKRVVDALNILDAMPKRAAGPVAKLLRSAVANASIKNITLEELMISKATVDKGMVIRRSMPRARGSSSMLHQRCSHIRFELSRTTGAKTSAASVSGNSTKKALNHSKSSKPTKSLTEKENASRVSKKKVTGKKSVEQ